MTVQEAFAIALRKLRHERKLSQEALSFESGVDRSYISELETGLKKPSLETLLRLARGIGISGSAFVAVVEDELGRYDADHN